MKRNTRLLLALSALISFQTGYMRLNFITMEQAGLLEFETLIFILYCAAMATGMIAMPLFLDSARLAGSPRKPIFIVRLCLGFAAAFAVLGFFSRGYAALGLQFCATFFYSGALATALRNTALTATPGDAGRLIGFSGAAMHIIIMILFYQPFVIIPAGAVIIILCAFLAAAGYFFPAENPAENPGEGSRTDENSVIAPFGNYVPFTSRVIKLVVVILCIFVIVGGLLDNIFFFDSVFTEVPNLHFYIFIYNMLVYAAVGFIFKRADPAFAVIFGFAFICASQSLAFFSEFTPLAYPYALMSNAGYITLEVYLNALPMAYIAYTKKKPGILPGLGFILLNGSFVIMAVLFEFIPPTFYTQALGVMLFIAIAAILVTVYLINENKTHKLNQLQDELRKIMAEKSVPETSTAEPLEPLTEREKEVLQFILTGKPNKEIGAAMKIGESTVKFHLGNVYSKYGVNSRAELISMFLRGRASTKAPALNDT